MKKAFLVVGVVLVVFALVSAVALVTRTPARPTGPVSVRVVIYHDSPDAWRPLARRHRTPYFGGPQQLHTGSYAPNLCVAIRNNMKAPIVIRQLRWHAYRDDHYLWLNEIYGPASWDSDGNVSHHLVAQTRSHLRFERGLILPGEEILVSTPMTPQKNGQHDLVIRYAMEPHGADWMKNVLLPGDDSEPRGVVNVYTPITEKILHTGKANAGRTAILRRTCEPDAVPLLEDEVTIQVQLPLSESNPKATGGLTADAAARKVGLDPSGDHYLAFYKEPLWAWFFVQYDGTSVALWKENGRWTRVSLPKMDPTTPDEFATNDKATSMLLRPDAFKDILKVEMPHYEGAGWYQVGETRVTSEKLWAVLERSRQRGIELRLVTFNSNGLENDCLLSAGVEVNKRGIWLDPKIEVSP